MIAVMVGGLVLLLLGLVLVWLMSPAFRDWSERPKFQMLEREAMYERVQTADPSIAKTPAAGRAPSPSPEPTSTDTEEGS